MSDKRTYWTTKELHTSGATDYDIARQVRDGSLYRLSRGIYTTTRPDGLMALHAISHRHPSVIFSGATAAAVYGLGTPSAPATGMVPANYRPIDSPALLTTRSRQRRHRIVDGLPVTTPAATIAALGRDDLTAVKFLERHYDGLKGADRFAADLRAMRPEQRAALDPVLSRAVIGASSRMERLFILDLRRKGLDVIPNFRFGPYTWDGGIPDGTTLFDLDSYRYHGPHEEDMGDMNHRTFIIDRWKSNHAEMFGWGHLQYTDSCLVYPDTRARALDEILRLTEHRRSRRRPEATPGGVNSGVWTFHGEWG